LCEINQLQEAVVGELKQKQQKIKEKKVLNRDEVYHGALEDILLGKKDKFVIYVLRQNLRFVRVINLRENEKSAFQSSCFHLKLNFKQSFCYLFSDLKNEPYRRADGVRRSQRRYGDHQLKPMAV
jgi:hypothetical protein